MFVQFGRYYVWNPRAVWYEFTVFQGIYNYR
jgi:hypothetical protein